MEAHHNTVRLRDLLDTFWQQANLKLGKGNAANSYIEG